MCYPIEKVPKFAFKIQVTAGRQGNKLEYF